MVKTMACRNAIGQILQMLVDDQQIPEDFMRFIDQCLSDYFYKKKLDYSLTSVLKFRQDWLEDKTIDEIKQILKEQYGKR
jgi:hypothetical protein